MTPVSVLSNLRLTFSLKNQVMEAQLLFECVESHSCFKEVPIFLFLNKTDILREKLEGNHALNDFPNNVEEFKALYAQRFHDIANQCFRDKAKERDQTRTIHVYHTNATNAESLRVVFNEVSEQLQDMRKRLKV